MQLKSEMESNYKTLSSSNDASREAVAAAESAFVEQAAVVDSLFEVRRLLKRAKDVKNCHEKTSSARTNFWSAVTGKVKQTCDIPAVLSASGAIKCDPDEICEEVEKHLCSVFQGSMETLVQQVSGQSDPGDHSYFSHPVNPGFEHNYSKIMYPRLNNVGNSDDLTKNPSNWMNRDFTVKEVKRIAATLNGGKAKRWDGIGQP